MLVKQPQCIKFDVARGGLKLAGKRSRRYDQELPGELRQHLLAIMRDLDLEGTGRQRVLRVIGQEKNGPRWSRQVNWKHVWTLRRYYDLCVAYTKLLGKKPPAIPLPGEPVTSTDNLVAEPRESYLTGLPPALSEAAAECWTIVREFCYAGTGDEELRRERLEHLVAILREGLR